MLLLHNVLRTSDDSNKRQKKYMNLIKSRPRNDMLQLETREVNSRQKEQPREVGDWITGKTIADVELCGEETLLLASLAWGIKNMKQQLPSSEKKSQWCFSAINP